jgi:hypothetical protein
MAKISGFKGRIGPATAPQPTGPVPTTPPVKAPASSDGFSDAAKGLLGYKSSPFVSGAIKIFGDNVILPANLTDPKDPRNDPKYLHLLAAVLGLDELSGQFFTLEGEKQEEYLAYKSEQRERRLAKKEREKEERRASRERDKEH